MGSKGNEKLGWRDRLGLDSRRETLPKLSDEFSGKSKKKVPGATPTLRVPKPGGAGAKSYSVKKPGSTGKEERRLVPPPPPRALKPPQDEADSVKSKPPVKPASSTASETFAERLKARRIAAEKAGSATGDSSTKGLHLRPKSAEKPEEAPKPKYGVKLTARDALEPALSIPPSSVAKADAKPVVLQKPESARAQTAGLRSPKNPPMPNRPAPATTQAAKLEASTKVDTPISAKNIVLPTIPLASSPDLQARKFKKSPFKTDDPCKSSFGDVSERGGKDFSSFNRSPGPVTSRNADEASPASYSKVDEKYWSKTEPSHRQNRDLDRKNDSAADYDHYGRTSRSDNYNHTSSQEFYEQNHAQDDELYEADQEAYGDAHGYAPGSTDGEYEDDVRRPKLGRPATNDYVDAYYNEHTDVLESEKQGGRGFVFLLALFGGFAVFGAIAAALFFFYLQNQPGDVAEGQPPLVTAPKSVKTEPPDQETPPVEVQTKQFYERIVGEGALEGEKLQSREELPVDLGMPALPSPEENSTEPQPLPPLPDDSGNLPVPLPPPLPGGTSGSLDPANGAAPTTNAAQLNAPSDVNNVPQSRNASSEASSSTLSDADANNLSDNFGRPQIPLAIGGDDIVPLPTDSTPRPRRKPTSVIRAAKNKPKENKVTSASPITIAPTEPMSIMPLPRTQVTPGQQLAALQPVAPQQPITLAPDIGSGTYVVQLASYKEQGSAIAGFQELRARHPSILGSFRPLISKKTFDGLGTFYRLQVGPIASSQLGRQICDSLISAGEKDCLVKRR